MKKTTIAGLALTLGLFLMGSVAYGAWNDRGPHGFQKDGYEYRCPNVNRVAYSGKANTPVARAAMPCRGDWHGKVKWTDDRRYDHHKSPGYRCLNFFSRCW